MHSRSRGEEQCKANNAQCFTAGIAKDGGAAALGHRQDARRERRPHPRHQQTLQIASRQTARRNLVRRQHTHAYTHTQTNTHGHTRLTRAFHGTACLRERSANRRSGTRRREREREQTTSSVRIHRRFESAPFDWIAHLLRANEAFGRPFDVRTLRAPTFDRSLSSRNSQSPRRGRGVSFCRTLGRSIGAVNWAAFDALTSPLRLQLLSSLPGQFAVSRRSIPVDCCAPVCPPPAHGVAIGGRFNFGALNEQSLASL